MIHSKVLYYDNIEKSVKFSEVNWYNYALARYKD